MKKEQFKCTACRIEKNAGCQVTTYLRDDHSPLKSCIMGDLTPPANWQQIITDNPPIAPVGGTGESSTKQPALQKQTCEMNKPCCNTKCPAYEEPTEYSGCAHHYLKDIPKCDTYRTLIIDLIYETCETCFYFRQLPNDDTCLGVCLRYPPDKTGRHSIIANNTIDYCGEYKEK